MGRLIRTMPKDFALYASVEGNLRLRKRYGTRGDTIERWRKELGVKFMPPEKQPAPRKAIKPFHRKRLHQLHDERLEDLGGWDMYSVADDSGVRSCGRGW